MKTIATIAAACMMSTSVAQAGVVDGNIHYTWQMSATTAQMGDTVELTVIATIDPGQSPFYALAHSTFDIMVADMPAGGTVSNHVLGAPFVAQGTPGTVVDNDIIGVTAGQLPAFINPTIDTGTVLELMTFDFTVDDATPRLVTFDLANVINDIYTGSGLFDPPATFGSSTTTGVLEVTQVPAPGAMALLGLAGVTARGRRRRLTN